MSWLCRECGEGSEETCLGRLRAGTCETPGCGRPAAAFFKDNPSRRYRALVRIIGDGFGTLPDHFWYHGHRYCTKGCCDG